MTDKDTKPIIPAKFIRPLCENLDKLEKLDIKFGTIDTVENMKMLAESLPHLQYIGFYAKLNVLKTFLELRKNGIIIDI